MPLLRCARLQVGMTRAMPSTDCQNQRRDLSRAGGEPAGEPTPITSVGQQLLAVHCHSMWMSGVGLCLQWRRCWTAASTPCAPPHCAAGAACRPPASPPCPPGASAGGPAGLCPLHTMLHVYCYTLQGSMRLSARCFSRWSSRPVSPARHAACPLLEPSRQYKEHFLNSHGKGEGWPTMQCEEGAPYMM